MIPPLATRWTSPALLTHSPGSRRRIALTGSRRHDDVGGVRLRTRNIRLRFQQYLASCSREIHDPPSPLLTAPQLHGLGQAATAEGLELTRFADRFPSSSAALRSASVRY